MAGRLLAVAGELAPWVALLMAAWAVVTSTGGVAMRRADLVESGRRALVATALALTVAVAGLVQALFTHDFAMDYVARHTAFGMGGWSTLAATWGGASGALLVAVWLGALLVAARAVPARRGDPRAGAAAAVLLLVALVVVVAFMNPYHRLAGTPVSGAGATPWMRHAGVVVGRLAALAGYACAGVAAAVALGHWRVRPADAWLDIVQPWVVGAWTLLSVALGLLLREAWLHTAVVGLWYPAPEIMGASLVWLAAAAALHAPDPVAGRVSSRVGQHVAHAGAIVAGIAFIGNLFTTTTTVHLPTGQPVSVSVGMGGTWRMVGQGMSQFARGDHGVSAFTVEATRGDETPRLLVARQLMFGTLADTTALRAEADPALVPGPLGALRVVLTSGETDAGEVRVSFVPLAWLLPLGALLCVVGGAATLAFRGRTREGVR